MANSRQACEAAQDGDRLSELGVCQMWGLGPRVDKQGSSFCRRGSGVQLNRHQGIVMFKRVPSSRDTIVQLFSNNQVDIFLEEV